MSFAPMNPCLCRQCQQSVTPELVNCPNCGAPRPAQQEWNGEGYEWSSTGTWMGYPLVHIAFGCGPDGKARVARGVVAIGQRAKGVIAIGIVATGFLSIGVFALGVLSIGVVSVGLGAALGVNAVAPLAIGVTAFGFVTVGLETIGWRKF